MKMVAFGTAGPGPEPEPSEAKDDAIDVLEVPTFPLSLAPPGPSKTSQRSAARQGGTSTYRRPIPEQNFVRFAGGRFATGDLGLGPIAVLGADGHQSVGDFGRDGDTFLFSAGGDISFAPGSPVAAAGAMSDGAPVAR